MHLAPPRALRDEPSHVWRCPWCAPDMDASVLLRGTPALETMREMWMEIEMEDGRPKLAVGQRVAVACFVSGAHTGTYELGRVLRPSSKFSPDVWYAEIDFGQRRGRYRNTQVTGPRCKVFTVP